MLFATECPICGCTGDGAVCARCADALEAPPVLSPPPGLDRCRALTGYQGVGRELVTRLKFHDRRAVVTFVAHAMCSLVRDDGVEVVTWAPTASKRRRRRGFDQAEVVAVALAAMLGVPARRCLVRLPGPPQTGRHRDERIVGPRFDSHRGVVAAVAGRRVALVDDVATTGATLSRAAAVLRAHGAETIVGVVTARTPVERGRSTTP